jgi:hypothetical protein
MYMRKPSWLEGSQVPTPEVAAAVGLSEEDLSKAWALAAVLCDASGVRFFDGGNPEHLRAVAALDPETAAHLVRAANEVYGGDTKNA